MPTEQVLANAAFQIERDIKTAMINKGFTVSSLAELINKNRSIVSQAIHGGTTPRDVETRKKIYKILGMED
ncbi:transcriptional regulator [Lactobacillus sp. ESL0677]|uniref:transcriptional regulator n=1 Tax=Lactobacillus sp. ESL0677 TaxID=2983208 RepID=UPI0023F6B15D|nr:transcriptional regulator [Lactobacillus sp. ESL0677]WEV36255.1 transcriptional regulator [Lactobacillus sp. ESL0677]